MKIATAFLLVLSACRPTYGDEVPYWISDDFTQEEHDQIVAGGDAWICFDRVLYETEQSAAAVLIRKKDLSDGIIGQFSYSFHEPTIYLDLQHLSAFKPVTMHEWGHALMRTGDHSPDIGIFDSAATGHWWTQSDVAFACNHGFCEFLCDL